MREVLVLDVIAFAAFVLVAIFRFGRMRDFDRDTIDDLPGVVRASASA
jgi:hypothetical protein